MTMLKVIEVLAESSVSWEDAAQVAVSNAAKTERNIRSITVVNQQATAADGKIDSYRINAKITFALD